MTALKAAVALVCAETTIEVALVMNSGRWTLLGRVAVALCIALQYLFAWRALHRSAGAVLGLVLWQISALLVAAGADWALVARVGLATAALTTIALLARATRAFPTPVLPR